MTLRVAVVLGGSQSEHAISLRSGAEVLEHLPADRYDAFPVLWRADGRWEIPPGADPADAAEALGRLREADAVFLALHGPRGEDGTVQGFLETAGIPYTGSGVLASALAMDKAQAKTVARSIGLVVAEEVVVRGPRWDLADAPARLGWPCVVKPVSGGSSADLRLVEDEPSLRRAVADLAGRWPAVLLEAFVAGREVTGPVLEEPETGEARALPLIEIRTPGRRLFDPEAKYVPGVAEEICPAPLDGTVAERVRDAARRIHEALGCAGFSRSDFIVRDGVPVYLETNTIPGLTRESLVPRAARTAGISMAALLDGLVRAALRRRRT